MKLDAPRFESNEHVNNEWTITVEAGTTIDDVLKPEFLANVSAKLRPYDHIRVRTDTGEWYAELLVITCGRVWAKLAKLVYLDLTTQDVDQTEAEITDKYAVVFRGPHLKFCVIRKSDNEPIKEQIGTKVEAQAWLSSYLLTM